jgi:thiol-disulfide isomerase/thioredoxin
MKGKLMRRVLLAVVALSLCLSAQVWAGKYNKQLSVGDAAPTWSGLEGVDGKTHALEDLNDKDVIVVCFTCNTCPYAVDYEDRLIALAKKFAGEGGKCAVVAINPNLVNDDLLPAMRDRAKQKGFNFTYLHDASRQQVARSYGATYTPEFVVLNKDRKVVYLGAMDDSPDGKKITKRYVEDAVTAALAGKLPEITETPAVGCAVRFVRDRK